AYWIGNQAIIQRSLGARSDFEAKASYIWGAVLKNVIPIIIAIPGLIAVAMFPELGDGDQAFPQLVGALLPVGFRGLFVAAFLAALMSSIDSYLNSSATIFTNDIYQRFIDRDLTDTAVLKVGRITTFVFVTWAILFAFLLTMMDEASGIYAVFQTLMAFFQGPALAVLLTGVLWKRATGKAACVAFVIGILTSVSLFAMTQETVLATLGMDPLFHTSEPFLYFSIWAFLVTLTILLVGSLMTKPEPAEKQSFTYQASRQSHTGAAE
ncbi:MAG: sodium transporter, partial [Planctomycetaceae bacterium]|nr:sodium transporter [Planctomycetaceae bacterium]